MKKKIIYVRGNVPEYMRMRAICLQGGLQYKKDGRWRKIKDDYLQYAEVRIHPDAVIKDPPALAEHPRLVCYCRLSEAEKDIHRCYDKYACREYWAPSDGSWLPTIKHVESCNMLTYRICTEKYNG